jgi:hypothetical protein
MERGMLLAVISDEWMGFGGGVVQQEMPAQVTAVMPREKLEDMLTQEHFSNDPTVVLTQHQLQRLLDEERLAVLFERIQKEYNF